MSYRYRRVSRFVSTALLGLGLGTAMPAHAAAVFQNDARSGGDAGDVMEQAVPITPGYYNAQLSPAGDLVDWYQIPLTRGDKVQLQLSDYNLLGLKSVHMMLMSPAGDAITLEPEGLMVAGTSYAGKAAELIVHETGTWYLKAQPVRDGVNPGDYGFRLTVTPGYGTVINTRNQSWIVLELHAPQPTRLMLQGRMHGHRAWDRAYWGTIAVERELVGRNPDGFGVGVRGGGQGTSMTATPLGLQGFDVIGPALDRTELEGTTLTAFGQHGVVQGYVRYIVALNQDDPWLSLGVWADQPITMLQTQGKDNVRWTEANSGADDAIVTPLVSQVGERSLHINLGAGFRGSFIPGNASDASVWRPDGSEAPLHSSCECITFRPAKYMGYTEDAVAGTWRFDLGESLSGPYRSPYLVGVRVQYPGLF